jgi:glycosyltransferase involved in cell wall biosynthesis
MNTPKKPLPKVSVIIPCFNVSKTIDRAINSVRIQNYAPLELVLVDDGSTDGTLQILQGMAGADVKIVELGSRSGAANARNEGIRASTGELIAFLDADDEWLPGKLHKQISKLVKDPEATFAGCASLFIAIGDTTPKHLYDGCIPIEGREAWRALLSRNYLATPSIIVWRAALERTGLFNIELPVAEDQDLWIRLALDGVLRYIDEPLLIVHDRLTSLSREDGLADQAVSYTLPMIMKYLNQHRDQLTRTEINRIIGERFSRSGRGIYLQKPALGLKLIVIGSFHGFEPLQNFSFLIIASRPVRSFRAWLKRILS